MRASVSGVNSGIPLINVEISNLSILSRRGTVLDGQFDWGGRLPKGNGGALRSSQDGRKSSIECKGTRRLDCESDNSSRCESRS